MRNAKLAETIHIVKAMAGPLMKAMMVLGLILNGEMIGLGENGEMIVLMVNMDQNG